MLGTSKGKRTRKGVGGKKHEKTGVQGGEEKIGGEREWPDRIIADHYK